MPMNLRETIFLQVCFVYVGLEKTGVTVCNPSHKECMLLAYVCLMVSADGVFLFVVQSFARVNADGVSMNTVLNRTPVSPD